MLTLAINTSSSIEAVAVLDGKKLLGEIAWRSNYDESEKLLPAIEKLLKKHRAKWADVERIVVVNGPGPFSAVRIGVTVANTLAMLTGAELFSLSSLELWKAKIMPFGDERTKRSRSAPVLLLHAGSRYMAVCKGKSDTEILPIDEAVIKYAGAKTFYGDITADEMEVLRQAQDDNKIKKPSQKFIDQKSLPSFGQSLLKLKQKSLKRCKIVQPKYFRPPNITSPKTPFKKTK